MKPMEANGDGPVRLDAPDTDPRTAEPRIASAFPPIADYAFLSDCEVNCLIAPSGRVEWMCLPRRDSPSVFAANAPAPGPASDPGPPAYRCRPAAATCRERWCWRPRGARGRAG